LAIVVCTGCSRKLRVPDGKRGTVTCPLCGAEWFHPDTIELSDVEFRCSGSGARFNVISSRRSPLHKFVVQKIYKPTRGAGHRVEAEQLSASKPPVNSIEAPLLAAPGIRGWLARAVGRKAEIVPSLSPSVVGKEPATVNSDPIATYNADEYSWSGFACPYCSATSFVSCSGGHLACDGTVMLRNDRRFHQCFCGHAGYIEGTMKSVESRRHCIEAETDSPTPPPAAERQRQDSRSANKMVLLSLHTESRGPNNGKN
jgi:hypothetical protein